MSEYILNIGSLFSSSLSLGFVVPLKLTSGAEKVNKPNLGTLTALPILNYLDI